MTIRTDRTDENQETPEERAVRFMHDWLHSPEVYVGSKPVAARQRERLREALVELIEQIQIPSRKEWFADLPAEVIDAIVP